MRDRFLPLLLLSTMIGGTASQALRADDLALIHCRLFNGYENGMFRKTWECRKDNEHRGKLMTSLDSTTPSFSSDLYHDLSDFCASLP